VLRSSADILYNLEPKLLVTKNDEKNGCHFYETLFAYYETLSSFTLGVAHLSRTNKWQWGKKLPAKGGSLK